MYTTPAPSTVDALTSLCTSVLEWHERLDALSGQIAFRQIELARFEELHPSTPSLRSLRNQGSTESLRPKDGPSATEEESPDGVHVCSPADGARLDPRPGQLPNLETPARTVAQTGAALTPPLQPFNPTPRPPGTPARPSSHPTSPVQARAGPAKLRKRKPESLASGESAMPKYRTRSMIIVYYDSAVQSAFEELVKFVSGSRNAMRKGRMAAKMAEMRRAAELEVEADGESDGDEDGIPQLSTLLARKRGMLAAPRGEPSSRVALDRSASPKAPPPDGGVGTLVPGLPRPTGKPREMHSDGLGKLSANVIRRSADGQPHIFEKIDKSLEWCQGQCEFAAHKFLREGECAAEIENIKNKLAEVRLASEEELRRLDEETAASSLKRSASRHLPDEGKAREMKPIQVRKGAVGFIKDLDSDRAALSNIEVDEGFEDMDVDEGFEDPAEIVYRRSKKIH